MLGKAGLPACPRLVVTPLDTDHSINVNEMSPTSGSMGQGDGRGVRSRLSSPQKEKKSAKIGTINNFIRSD